MKKRQFVFLLFVFLLGCGMKETNEKDMVPGNAEMSQELTLTPEIVTNTPTPEPTATSTPSPTPTSTPSPTPTEIPDMTAPVIEGTSDKSIYVGETNSYKKDVTVSDDMDAEVDLVIDTSGVLLDTPGEYTVTYTATDDAGNVTSETITVTVKEMSDKEKAADRLADELIDKLVTEDMSKWDTCYALWYWCQTQIRSSNSHGDRSSIYAGAYEGLNDRCGDCYAYYATFTLLLEKCDIETIVINRTRNSTSKHWWNLVNLGDGWYHCDPSPRKRGHTYKCFMQTDAQVQEYNEFFVEKPDFYAFDAELYPERATEIVFDGELYGPSGQN